VGYFRPLFRLVKYQPPHSSNLTEASVSPAMTACHSNDCSEVTVLLQLRSRLIDRGPIGFSWVPRSRK
jgi:hypothetical protein